MILGEPCGRVIRLSKIETRGWRTSAWDACAQSFFTNVSLLKGDFGNGGVRHVWVDSPGISLHLSHTYDEPYRNLKGKMCLSYQIYYTKNKFQ